MLLNVNMYNNIPTIIPRKINILISPLLKNQILYKINIPVKIQNKISSIYVIVFEVFILLLKILKKSNHLCYNVSYGKNSDYSDC